MNLNPKSSQDSLGITTVVSLKEDEQFEEQYLDEFLYDDVSTEDDESVEILYLQCKSSDEADSDAESTKAKSTSSKTSVRSNINPVRLKDGTGDHKCRLCMRIISDYKDIFEETIENDIPLFVAIISCIQPLEIVKGDKLSDKICTKCFFIVHNYFRFRKICLQKDKEQRGSLKPNENNVFSKRKKPQYSYQPRKRRITEADYETDSTFNDLPEFDEDYEEDLIEFFERERVDIEEEKLIKIEQIDKPGVEVEFSKGGKIEGELRQLLECALPKEQAEAENIIIHVHNDDEEENGTVINKTNMKQSTSYETNKFKSSSVIVSYDEKENVKEGMSDIGLFEATNVKYMSDFEFCILDGYVFVYRLCKGKVRHLNCVLPTCPAKALQDKISDYLYSNAVSVERPHNHPRPDEEERKKQMFFFVMVRKLHCDRSLNIRSVYEEIYTEYPEIKSLVPVKNVISEICKHQVTFKYPVIKSYQQFFNLIEEESFQRLQFTQNGKQFYQEKLVAGNSQAIVFGNKHIIDQISDSLLMYVDSSFRIETDENFKYHLITVLVWVEDSYYPIYFGLINEKSRDIYRVILQYLHDVLAPNLNPKEIITDFEANLYYALGDVYQDSTIGGSVFYYTQNLYKRICALNVSRDLETNGNFRNIYHMLLMLPLLPVNTIVAGLNNIETQAKSLGLSSLMKPVFEHIRTEWIKKVTPNFFCVHKLENRITENVTAPFKKLRDYLMLSKRKFKNKAVTIATVVEKLIELEYFLQVTYSGPSKKGFSRELSSIQKRNVLKAWQFIERHPKININSFFGRVLGYIKRMENQLWIWGFYRYSGSFDEELIDATNICIEPIDEPVDSKMMQETCESSPELNLENNVESGRCDEYVPMQNSDHSEQIMDAVIDENGMIQTKESLNENTSFNGSFLQYIKKECT